MEASAASRDRAADRVRSFTQADADRLNARYADADTAQLLRGIFSDPEIGAISIVSSFGTESAVLLHLVAQVDAAATVRFIDTDKLFPETLRYRDQLARTLGLTDVRTFQPDAQAVTAADPKGLLWSHDPDACCAVRKVATLARALEGVSAWISGRKAFQAPTRGGIPLFEIADCRLKINPLARWTKADLDAYFAAHDLPRHPLEADGYLSIGCMPCTSPVAAGEDPRAGRWRGWDKTECGIHTPAGQTEKLPVF